MGRLLPTRCVLPNFQPLCRLEVHQSALAAAKAKLLALMAAAPEEHLTQLLSATFAYIGLLPLREVFLAIVGRNVPMDGSQLDGIAADPELFNELPMNVKRQVTFAAQQ